MISSLKLKILIGLSWEKFLALKIKEHAMLVMLFQQQDFYNLMPELLVLILFYQTNKLSIVQVLIKLKDVTEVVEKELWILLKKKV